MKPSWKDAPGWAQYLSMDEDGSWWWYEYEPSLCRFHSRWSHSGARVEIAYDSDDHWKSTLEQGPANAQTHGRGNETA